MKRRWNDLEGMELRGLGSDRIVYDLPGGDVVKLDFGEPSQSRYEVALWRHASVEDASKLCPILAAGPGWLVMPRATLWDEGDETPDGRDLSDLEGLSFDADDSNAMIYRGHLVLVDYGSGSRPGDPPRRSNPAPSKTVCARRYYHGTDREDLARGIVSSGIQPRSVTMVHEARQRAKLAPVPGKIYLAADVGLAQVYALGGSMAGSAYPEAAWRGRGRWGYLFVLDGAELCDVEPDEDAVGQAVGRYLDPQLEVSEYDSWPEMSRALINDPDRLRWIGAVAERVMTARQRRSVRDGLMADMAAVGKKVVKVLPAELRLWLIEHGASVAHSGALMPIEAWRIDKSRAFDLRRDGGNFFDVAEPFDSSGMRRTH